jgi:hypothetical protein
MVCGRLLDIFSFDVNREERRDAALSDGSNRAQHYARCTEIYALSNTPPNFPGCNPEWECSLYQIRDGR